MNYFKKYSTTLFQDFDFMRSLILFILKYQNFILFIILELASLFLLVNRNNYHNSKFYNLTLSTTSRMYEQRSQIVDYFSLRTINEVLARENAILQEIIIKGSSKESISMLSIQDTLADNDIDMIAAKVVKTSVAQQHNLMTINKGSKDGVAVDMAVISPTGTAGVVKVVSENYSIVLPLINVEYRVSSKFRNNDYFGTLQWDTQNYKYASLLGIEKHVDVAIGDTIVTSGYGAIYPEGVMIGKIMTIESGEEGVFHDLKVELATDYKSLTYVYVISNNTMPERRDLEKETETN